MGKSKYSTLGRFFNYVTNTLCLNRVVLACGRTPGCVYVVREGRGEGKEGKVKFKGGGESLHPHLTSKNPAYCEFLVKKVYFVFVLLWLLKEKNCFYRKDDQKNQHLYVNRTSYFLKIKFLKN